MLTICPRRRMSHFRLQILSILIGIMLVSGQVTSQTSGTNYRPTDRGTDGGGTISQWYTTWSGGFSCKSVNDSNDSHLAHITTSRRYRIFHVYGCFRLRTEDLGWEPRHREYDDDRQFINFEVAKLGVD